MTSDFQYVSIWWVTLFFIGVVFFPISNRIFSAFYDKGYIFSKTLGLALVGYSVFLLSSLHILPFTQISILFVVWIFILINLFLLKKRNFKFYQLKIPKIIIAEELLFLGAFLFWIFIRGHEPSIHSLEKFMDFGFINSILRTTYMPPKDMWFPPFSINYYYFGHFTTALIIKLTNIPPQIGYNIMLCSLFAFTFTSSFSIGINLIRSSALRKKNILSGILSGTLVALGGNLHTIYALFTAYKADTPVPPWKLQFLLSQLLKSGDMNPINYWYANATRFIPFTIHEFPLYSFVVADLHGHVIDIPFVLFTIAVIFSLYLSKKLSVKLLILIALLLSVMYMTNVWDGVIYYLLTILVIFIMIFKDKTLKYSKAIEYIPFNRKKLVKTNSVFTVKFTTWILYVAIVSIGFFSFSLPFSLHFKPFVSGIGVLCTPDFVFKKDAGGKAVVTTLGPLLFEPDHCQKSEWWELFILYGFFYFFAISFLIYNSWNSRPRSSHLYSGFPGAHFMNTVAKQFKSLLSRNGHKNQKNETFFSEYSDSIGNNISYTFILILIFLSTLLIIIPEFMYAKDIYPAHYRANTMFKLVYQAFIMLSLVSAYSIVILGSAMKKTLFLQLRKKQFIQLFGILLYGVIATLGIVLVIVYPFFAIQSYYSVLLFPQAKCASLDIPCTLKAFSDNATTNINSFKGLDGQVFLKDQYKDDYDAIQWINTTLPGQPVMLEAQGDSYTDYERISSQTGLPTILGWTVHEWLWRGTYDIPAPRIEEVKTIYETQDAKTARKILSKYAVTYVYIGGLERQKYPNLFEPKFSQLGSPIYKNTSVVIYKLYY